MQNANAVQRDGAGGGSIAGSDDTTIQTPATTDNRERPDATATEGQGCARYRRARAQALVACVVEHFALDLDSNEMTAVRTSVRKLPDPGAKAFELLLEWTAPSRECADPIWFWGTGSEQRAASIIAARLHGWMPNELIHDAARVAAAVIYGAKIIIERRPAIEVKAREIDSLCRVLRAGVSDAA